MKQFSGISILLSFVGFIAFHYLSIWQGQKGEIGWSIGYATLSIAFIVLLAGIMILEKIDRIEDSRKSRQNLK